MSSEFPSNDRQISATIASGQTLSAEIDLGGMRLCGIHIPSGFDGAHLSLQAAPSSSGTYGAIRDKAGTELRFSVTAGDLSKVDPIDALGLRFVKLAAESSQSGDSVFTLVCTTF